MNTISAYENDLGLQLKILEKFSPQKIINHAVFVGSGDSLCAAMLAEAFSDYQIRAIDPLELAQNKKITHKKHAYFVSISGNTISNVRAAKLVKSKTAITKNPSSRLGKICNHTIPLDYVDSGVLTAGSIGFLASALTCISLVQKFRIKNPKKIMHGAKIQAAKIKPKGKIYFLGNQYTYPIAMYGSAKLSEILGMDSNYEKIEQFSHMGLFTAKKGDTVIILEGKNSHNSKLASYLKKLGIRVFTPCIGGDKFSQVLFYIFISQFLALNLAKQKKIRECFFISQKKIRSASSGMIY